MLTLADSGIGLKFRHLHGKKRIIEPPREERRRILAKNLQMRLPVSNPLCNP
jgi:hypothetical protein